MPPPERMSFRFRLRTRWSDEDALGVLNNAVHATLLEEGRLRWCERLGLLRGGGGFGFVLARTRIDFLAPGRGCTEVELQMATLHLGRKSFVQAYRLAEPDGGPTWTEADAVLVWWDPERRCSVPIPPEVRRAVREAEPAAGGD